MDNTTLPSECLKTNFGFSVPWHRRYIYPPFVAIGLVGNLLVLLVLTSRYMRTKTNVFLSAMAFADFCFFMCLTPTVLLSFASSHIYRMFFIYSRVPLSIMNNMNFTVSTWLAIAVTAERMFAIRDPLHVKLYFTRKVVFMTVVSIYFMSCILHGHDIVLLSRIRPFVKSYCNNTKFVYGLKMLNETVSSDLHTYTQISSLIFPFVALCIPMIVLIVLNSFLIHHLRTSGKYLINSTYDRQIKNKSYKVTVTVAIIVLFFIILSIPWAIIYLQEWFRSYVFHHRRSQSWVDAAAVVNVVNIIHKSLNFALYCAISTNFRQNFLRLLCRLRISRSNRTNEALTTEATPSFHENKEEIWPLEKTWKVSKTDLCSMMSSKELLSPAVSSRNDVFLNELRSPSTERLNEITFSKPVIV